MRIHNPTKEKIKPFNRFNGKWFDGILPGQTLNVDSSISARALLKCGCVEIKEYDSIDEPVIEKTKKRRSKKKKR